MTSIYQVYSFVRYAKYEMHSKNFTLVRILIAFITHTTIRPPSPHLISSQTPPQDVDLCAASSDSLQVFTYDERNILRNVF
jgi:hypothetical protein